LRDLDRRLEGALIRHVQRRRSELRSVTRALPSAEALLNVPRQRLDLIGTRLPGALRAGIHRREIALGAVSRRLSAQSPQARLGRYRERLNGFEARLRAALQSRKSREQQLLMRSSDRLRGIAERLPRAFGHVVAQKEQRLESLWKLLNTLGHRQVLARGYAIIRDGAGRTLRSAGEVKEGERLGLNFADGIADAVGGRPPAGAGKPPKQVQSEQSGKRAQGSLF